MCKNSCSNSCSCTCPVKEVDCCKCPERMDCCTPQFQRLDRLATSWMLNALGADITSGSSIDRTGNTESNANSNLGIAQDFVHSTRALDIERCKEENVWGWTVNVSSGELVLMQTTDGVSVEKTRSSLLDETCETMSLLDRKAKQVLDRLFHMSVKALTCNKYPRTEGVMVIATDKCNQKWLLLINRATGRDNILTEVDYVVVGSKL